MDFLDKVYFDNTLRSYLVVGGTILLVLLLKRYLSRYIVSLFFRVVKKVWKTVSKKSFVTLVVGPFERFLVLLISIFAIDKLNFPDILLYTLYGHTTADIVARIGTGIIIASFILLVLRMIDFIAFVLEEKTNLALDTRDNQLVVFLRDFLKVIIGIIGVLLIIKACFNQPLGNLLTGLSIVGAALALGAKESLENLIASFIIFFDKPFFTGDTVKVNNIIGRVEKIGLRSTRILTGDKTIVTMPNKQMVDSIVDNWSMRTQRRAEIILELSVKTPATKAENIIAETKKILAEKEPRLFSYSVFLKDISKNGMTIMAEYFTDAIALSEFDTLKQTINLQIKKLLEDNTAEFFGEPAVMVSNNNDPKQNQPSSTQINQPPQNQLL
ncbi:mechanosensitive ion channel family protein [Ferruginibacter sp.]|uniref:mechanosensitive ion channel family protein n=1 Tax=Ferruginibacter sp. TaxID=1940288 RepID=UPI00199BF26F|nr:mechanosensitive ion channel family protein [Ferruginibacter sp.]MBC7628806.1 mechanosensitive ion channel family protein [Ferruginibacter sp.]